MKIRRDTVDDNDLMVNMKIFLIILIVMRCLNLFQLIEKGFLVEFTKNSTQQF